MEPRYLQFVDANGKEHIEKLDGPGGTIRVAIGEQGRRSSTWRIWANPTADDVYIAARTIAGIRKYSLHQSGDWRHQWVTEAHAIRHGETTNRIMDQWERPEPPEHGIIPGLSIWIPHGSVDEVANDPDTPDDVIYLPEAPANHFAGIHVTVWTPDKPGVDLDSTVPIDAFTLASGDVVAVFYSQRPIAEHDWAFMEDALTKVEAAHAERGTTIAAEATRIPALRIGLHGNDDEGRRFTYDISASRVVGKELTATEDEGG